MIVAQKNMIACGRCHSVALLHDGTVRCWGDNKWDQCDPIHRAITNVQLPCDHTVLLW